MLNKIMVVLLLVVSLNSCGTIGVAKGPNYADAPKPVSNGDKSVVYIYRVDTIGGGSLIPGVREAHKISIDSSYKFRVINKKYSWLELDPGEHKINILTRLVREKFFGEKDTTEFSFITEAGKNYYINYTQDIKILDVRSTVSFYGGIAVPSASIKEAETRSFRMVPEEEALKTLKRYQYLKVDQ